MLAIVFDDRPDRAMQPFANAASPTILSWGEWKLLRSRPGWVRE